MASQAPITREYRIYLALWRKALKSRSQVKIQTSNFAMAIAMRQGMYRAIRAFRSGARSDEELRTASEKFVVYLEKGATKNHPHYLILKERAALAELEESLDLLGIDEEDLLLGDERSLLANLQELIERKDAPVVRPTHFYTREN